MSKKNHKNLSRKLELHAETLKQLTELDDVCGGKKGGGGGGGGGGSIVIDTRASKFGDNQKGSWVWCCQEGKPDDKKA